MVKEYLNEKEHFKQIKGDEEVNKQGKSVPSKRNKYRDRVERKSCVSWETKKLVSTARKDVQRKREEDKVNEVMGARFYKALQTTLRTFFRPLSEKECHQSRIEK